MTIVIVVNVTAVVIVFIIIQKLLWCHKKKNLMQIWHFIAVMGVTL